MKRISVGELVDLWFRAGIFGRRAGDLLISIRDFVAIGHDEY